MIRFLITQGLDFGIESHFLVAKGLEFGSKIKNLQIPEHASTSKNEHDHEKIIYPLAYMQVDEQDKCRDHGSSLTKQTPNCTSDQECLERLGCKKKD